MSPLELAVIGLLVVLLFGTKRLPELGSGMGKAISNFRRSYREGTALDVTPEKKESVEQQQTQERTEVPKSPV